MHVGWSCQAAGILNPTVAIDSALENVRELDDGYGPQRLATLAAYALRINLLQWLEQYRLEREHERRQWQQREHVQVPYPPDVLGCLTLMPGLAWSPCGLHTMESGGEADVLLLQPGSCCLNPCTCHSSGIGALPVSHAAGSRWWQQAGAQACTRCAASTRARH